MKVLIAFFLRYLLAPLLGVGMVFIITNLNIAKKKLSVKKLIIFILLTALIISLPSLFGFLRNEYIWGGLILTSASFLLLGGIYCKIVNTTLFEGIGLGKSRGVGALVLVIISILGGWSYFLLFEWISGLSYSIWCLSSVLWFLVPYMIKCSLDLFLNIPRPIYIPWELDYGTFDRYYWDRVDNFGANSVRVKIKRKIEDPVYATLVVRLPKEITIGNWFNWFIEDQNRRFPQEPIETYKDDVRIGWTFYTAKWFRFPLFIRRLDPHKTSQENRIKNNQIIFIRRVQIEDSQSNLYEKD